MTDKLWFYSSTSTSELFFQKIADLWSGISTKRNSLCVSKLYILLEEISVSNARVEEQLPNCLVVVVTERNIIICSFEQVRINHDHVVQKAINSTLVRVFHIF